MQVLFGLKSKIFSRFKFGHRRVAFLGRLSLCCLLRSRLFRLAQVHHVGMPQFLPFVTKLFPVRHRRSRPPFGAESTDERF